MNAHKERCVSPPRENILRIWEAAVTRSQMRHNNREFVEYIWLRRICHHFELLGLDPHREPATQCHSISTQTDMEELRNVTIDSERAEADPATASSCISPKSPLRYMSVFSFLDAIRLHKSVSEIERHRRGPERSTVDAVASATTTPTDTNPGSATGIFPHKEDDILAAPRELPERPIAGPSVSSPNVPEYFSGAESSPSKSLSSISGSRNRFYSSSSSSLQQATCRSSPSGHTRNIFSNAQTTASNVNVPHQPRTPEYTYTYSYSDALKYAIMYGHLEYTIYLLETHLEQALLETVCCPLLLVAVRLGHPDIVEQLCSHSRRKSAHNFYINKHGCSAMEGGRTALHVAAEMGNVVILQILLKYGADAHAKDDHGQTPLGRILYRLQAPHITNKTVRCINEMLKCQEVVTATELSAISRIMLEAAPTVTDVERPIISQFLDLVPGPLSLKFITRNVVRKVISYPYLPEGLQGINLPNTLRRFLAMDE